MSQELKKAMSVSLSYEEENKKKFHRVAKKVLKSIAQQMGLGKADFEIRSNMSGIASSGDVILHTDKLYISISEPFGGGQEVMYRSCDGRKDYSGGQNRWLSAEKLDSKSAIDTFKKIQDLA